MRPSQTMTFQVTGDGMGMLMIHGKDNLVSSSSVE